MDKKTISAPIINPLARDRLYEVIQRSQVPQTVETTLANALNGSIWEQRLLFVAMVDTWPRLQKALEEIYGQVNINIKDGTYVELPKEEEAEPKKLILEE